MKNNKQKLRNQIVSLRSKLTNTEKKQKSNLIYNNVITNINLHDSLYKNIAFYYPFKDEVNVLPLFYYCNNLQKNCYFPVMVHTVDKKQLVFYKCDSQSKFSKNKYGIFEPEKWQQSTCIMPQNLDLIFIPMIAFDETKIRLGMGGGFYDRTFYFKLNKQENPILIGLAYQLQQVSKHDFVTDVWDLTLDHIVTEDNFL